VPVLEAVLLEQALHVVERNSDVLDGGLNVAVIAKRFMVGPNLLSHLDQRSLRQLTDASGMTTAAAHLNGQCLDKLLFDFVRRKIAAEDHVKVDVSRLLVHYKSAKPELNVWQNALDIRESAGPSEFGNSPVPDDAEVIGDPHDRNVGKAFESLDVGFPVRPLSGWELRKLVVEYGKRTVDVEIPSSPNRALGELIGSDGCRLISAGHIDSPGSFWLVA
jgi:hypothetical protein